MHSDHKEIIGLLLRKKIIFNNSEESVEIIKVLYSLCTLRFVHLFVSICHGWAKFSVYVYTVTHTAVLGFLLTVDGTFKQHLINPLTSLGTPFVIMETAIYICHLLI